MNSRARLFPPSSASPDITAKLAEAVAAFEALPAVDRALHLADQRRSFVRGQCGRDPGPDVLAAEVRRLRALLEEAKAIIEPFEKAHDAATLNPINGQPKPDDDIVWAHSFEGWSHATGAVSQPTGFVPVRHAGELSVGHFRKARAFLTRLSGKDFRGDPRGRRRSPKRSPRGAEFIWRA